MGLRAIRVAAEGYPAEEQPCLRCGETVALRFASTCPACTAELRSRMQREARETGPAEFVPKMHVTPNAVALKE